MFLFVFLSCSSNFFLILRLSPACPPSRSSSSLQSTPWDASAECQEAEEQQRRHAGSVLASRTSRTRQSFLAEVREARALGHDQQASLLITAISSLSTARPQALDEARGEEASRSTALLLSNDCRILLLLTKE